MKKYDVIIIGAGAAGIMAGITAAERGRSVLIIDHADAPLRKVKIAGGGRCNFTNLNAGRDTYVSENSRFHLSALSQFGPWDFIGMVTEFHIPYYEKKLGQQFCETSSQPLIDMLLSKCETAGVTFMMNTSVKQVSHAKDEFTLQTSEGVFTTSSLIIATGGLSIPAMKASDFGYQIAEQFKLPIIPVRPALVPFTTKGGFADLAGVALPARVSIKKRVFDDDLLFTHRGLSGPAILQISSYWQDGQAVILNLFPDQDIFNILKEVQHKTPKKSVEHILSNHLPKRLAKFIATRCHCAGDLANTSDKVLRKVSDHVHRWEIIPTGTEGYKVAEVTVGGIDTNVINSKTMEVKDVPGLFFVGEVLDVTGWLGGYNLQWAWSSGYVAGLNA